MAGSINLSDSAGVSMASYAFNDMVDLIRAEARPEDENVMSDIYRMLDDGGLRTISTRKQDAFGFNVFAEAVMRAHAKAPREADGQVRFQELWHELLSKIKADPRYIAPKERHG